MTNKPKVKIIKKRNKRFHRHQSDIFKRVKPSWRKPKGIDNKVRRKFRSNIRMPNIGFRNEKKHRDKLPNGLKKFRVCNVKDLDALLMHGKEYCAEIAHTVSSKKRKLIYQKAQELEIKIINLTSKVTTEEVE